MNEPEESWQEVKGCMQCPLRYKTGEHRMCSLGFGEIPSTGIHRECRVIRPYLKLMVRSDWKPNG